MTAQRFSLLAAKNMDVKVVSVPMCIFLVLFETSFTKSREQPVPVGKYSHS